MKKIYSNSFAARLTAAQREELFTALAGGLGYAEAAVKVRDWMRENEAARPAGSRVRREIKLSAPITIGKWYQAVAVERRYEVAKAAALVTQASCPADYDEQARRALGQARFLATLEGLRVSEIVALEKNEIARAKLAFDAHRKECNHLLNRATLLLKRKQGGEESEDLQHQIDLAIEKMRLGEDA